MMQLSLAQVLGGAVLLCVAARQPPPFRGGVVLVPVYATVTNKDHRLVSGLSRDEFELFDNGRPQAIAFFSNEVQPLSVVVMIDRSGSMIEHSDLVTIAAEQFVSKLLGPDRARIGSFSWEIVLEPPDFTNDRSALGRVLRRELKPSGPSPVWTAVHLSIIAVRDEPGRRVVLLFSDGHDAPKRDQTRTDVRELLRRAEAGDVMIYTIGVMVPEEPGDASPAKPRTSVVHREGKRRLLLPDPSLRKLAEVSGGGYFQIDWESNLNATFERVADELHHQYVLGFVPQTLDGTVHKIEVRVRRPGTTVRTRKTYVATRER
jgi:Ca-activated chloride channel family protein